MANRNSRKAPEAEKAGPTKAGPADPAAEVSVVALHTVQTIDEFGCKVRHKRGDLFKTTEALFNSLKTHGAVRLATADEVKAAVGEPVDIDEEEAE